MSSAWLARLRRQVIATRRVKSSIWWDVGAPPRTFFEQVIARLYQVARPGDACAGAEYWLRCQGAHTGFHYHFDRDEGIKDRVVSPIVGSVLYLSSVGGPTLVLDVTPTSAACPTRVVGVFPHPGRYMTFPGQLLHGVQSGEPNRWPRVAFFVNWWATQPGGTVAEVPRRILEMSPLATAAARHDPPSEPLEQPSLFPASDLFDPEDWPHFRQMFLRTTYGAGGQ